jgi:hypothetical protein
MRGEHEQRHDVRGGDADRGSASEVVPPLFHRARRSAPKLFVDRDVAFVNLRLASALLTRLSRLVERPSGLGTVEPNIERRACVSIRTWRPGRGI